MRTTAHDGAFIDRSPPAARNRVVGVLLVLRCLEMSTGCRVASRIQKSQSGPQMISSGVLAVHLSCAYEAPIVFGWGKNNQLNPPVAGEGWTTQSERSCHQKVAY